MDLLKDQKIRNYSVEEKLYKTKEYTMYKMIRDSYKPCYVCEYFPKEYIKRDDSGQVIFTEGTEDAYSLNLKKFTDTAMAAKSLRYDFFLMPMETFVEDNIGYAAFELPEGTKLLDHLENNGGKLSYTDAFKLLDPFIKALIESYKKDIFYKVEFSKMNLYYSKLIYTGLFVPEYKEDYLIEDIANLFYTMITGKEYVQMLVRPSMLGVSLPNALDDFIYDSLFSNPVFTSLDDYYEKLKLAVSGPAIVPIQSDAVILQADPVPPEPSLMTPPEGVLPPMPPSVTPSLDDIPKPNTRPSEMTVGETAGSYHEGPYAPPPQGMPQGNYVPPAMEQKKMATSTKAVIGCAGFGCFGLIVISILIAVFVSAVGSSSANIATEPSKWIGGTSVIGDFDVSYYDYEIDETYAFINVANELIALNDSIIEDQTHIFYPLWDDGWHFISENKENGDKEILLSDVFPTFMAIENDLIVYADAFRDYHIYAINKYEPGNPTLVFDYRSAYLQLSSGVVYFVNLEDSSTIYSVSLNGQNVNKLNSDISEYLNIYGNNLYYLNLSNNYNTYQLSIDGTADALINTTDSDNLLCDNGVLYYINYDTRYIESMSLLGDQLAVYDEFEAYCFDVKDGYIYYSDYDYKGIFSYNIETGEKILLSSTAANYIKVCGGKLFFYDYSYGYLGGIDLNNFSQMNLYVGDADFFNY